MAKSKYKNQVNWRLEKEDGTEMAGLDAWWVNMEYEDVVKFEGAVFPAIIMSLGELAQQELEIKKKP